MATEARNRGLLSDGVLRRRVRQAGGPITHLRVLVDLNQCHGSHYRPNMELGASGGANENSKTYHGLGNIIGHLRAELTGEPKTSTDASFTIAQTERDEPAPGPGDRQDCRQQEGVGADKRNCKQQGRQTR